jgi:glyoxylate/hydroxypyruvate/2-ketogluconate reductase
MPTNLPLVLVSGPPAASSFLSKVTAALPEDRCRTMLLVDGTPPADHPAWSDVDLLVVFAHPCDAASIAKARALKAIIVPSIGFDGIDVTAATVEGIVVANGAVAENIESVAEAAIGLMVAASYEIRGAEHRLRDNVGRSGPPVARMLRGKRLGFIGFGAIARAIAERLSPWGMEMVAHSRRRIDPAGLAVRDMALDELLATSDFILPLLPLSRDTHHFLGRSELLKAKEGAVLVNVSRGAVIDEAALGDPAIASRFKAIALDVFEKEPLPVDSPLRLLPNAILTGHEIAQTAENLAALFQRTLTNVEDALAARIPATALNPEAAARLFASADRR